MRFPLLLFCRGCSGKAMALINFGAIWIKVKREPTVVAVVAGCCLDFSLVYHYLFSFSLSLGDGQIKTKILSKK